MASQKFNLNFSKRQANYVFSKNFSNQSLIISKLLSSRQMKMLSYAFDVGRIIGKVKLVLFLKFSRLQDN